MKALPVEIIGVMDHPGRATLLPWLPDGERVQAWINEAATSLEGGERERLLLEVQGRYMKFSLDNEERITVPPNLLANLGVSIGQYVWIYFANNNLWISSKNPADKIHDLIPHNLP